MLISWNDVNRTQEMGNQSIVRLNISVFVREHEIENWRKNPQGRHELVKSTDLSGVPGYCLGKFHSSI